MGTTEELIELLEDVEATPELIAHVVKVEDIVSGITSIDFPLASTEDYATLTTELTDVGFPAEAKAELDKIKSLLLE